MHRLLTVPQNDTHSAAGAATVSWRRVVDGVRRFLFGHDIFVSYARADAIEYAQGLADALVRRRIAAYIDQLGTPPGLQMPPLLLMRLRLSSMLVLVASPAAAASIAVQQEVEAFSRRNHRLFVVDVDGALDTVEWYRSRIKGGPARRITAAELRTGTPSDAVADHIAKNVDFARREDRLRKAMRYTLVAIGTLLLVGAVSVVFLRRGVVAAQQDARLARNEGDQQRLLATQFAASAESSRVAAAQADSLRDEAQALAQTASAEARTALDSVEARRRTARAMSLATQASAAFDNHGRDVVHPLLLAVESLREDWTVAGAAAWLRAMALLPPRLGEGRSGGAPVTAIAVTLDGRRIASGDQAGYIQIWDVAERAGAVMLTPRRGQPEVPPQHRGEVHSVAFSHDGQSLAAAVNGTLVLWRLDGTRPALRKVERLSYGADHVVFSPDDGTLAVAEGIEVHLFDTSVWTVDTLRHPPMGSMRAAFSPDGSLLVSGGLQIWNVATRTLVGVRSGRDSGQSGNIIGFTADGSQLITEGDVWQVTRDSTGRPHVAEQPNPTTGWIPEILATDPLASHLLTVRIDSGVSLYNAHTRREVARIPVKAMLYGPNIAAFGPDGRWVAIGTTSGAVTVWPGAPHNESILIPQGWASVTDVAFSLDGRWLAVATTRGVRVMETGSWREVMRASEAGTELRFTADGRWLLTLWSDGSIRPFQVGTWREMPVLSSNGVVEDLWISPHGQWLAARSDPNRGGVRVARPVTIRVWDLPSGRELGWRHVFDSLRTYERNSSVQQGGRVTLTVQAPSWIPVKAGPAGARAGWTPWESGLSDAATGQKLVNFDPGHGEMLDAEVSPDGRWLVTGGEDGTVRLWRLSPAATMIAEACARLPRNFTREEWERTFPGRSYRPTCPRLPIPPPTAGPPPAAPRLSRQGGGARLR